MPNKLKSIGKKAFSHCLQLKNVKLPKSLVKIGNGCFEYCPIVSIEIPTMVERIQENTFNNCRNLRSVKIPNGLVAIKEQAFGGCVKLKCVKLNEGIQEIHTHAFFDCDCLTNLNVPKHLQNQPIVNGYRMK